MSLISPSRRGLLTGAASLAAMALVPPEEAWAQRQRLRFAAAGSAGPVVTLDPTFHATNVSIGGTNNLTATCSANTPANMFRATKAIPNGGVYWEETWTVHVNSFSGMLDSTNTATGTLCGDNATSGSVVLDGRYFYNGSVSTWLSGGAGAVPTPVTLVKAWNNATKIAFVFLPGVGWGTDGGGTATTGGRGFGSIGSTVYPGGTLLSSGDNVTCNFGFSPFVNVATGIADCIAAGYTALEVA